MGYIRTHYLWRLGALFLVFTFLSISCGSQPQIIGKWRRVSGSLCSAVYPATIEFFDDGKYVGELPNWSGGSYRVVEAHRLRLDTSIGPGVYQFNVSNNILVFKNAWGCTFKYTKEH